MSITGQEPSAPRITRQDLETRSPVSQSLITQFAVAGVMLSGLLTGATAVPPAAVVPVQARIMRDSARWSSNRLSADDLQSLDLVIGRGMAASLQAPLRPGGRPATAATQVRRLWQTSGLTGEQVARLFGVSRRAVHLWGSGGRMNAAHHERLSRLVAIVDTLPGDTPAQRRAALLLPHDGGASLFDRLRADYASNDTDVSGTPWRPADLLSDEQEPEGT